MRWLLAVLVLLLAFSQYRLWFADGSLAEKHRLEQQAAEQALVNEQLLTRNDALEREVRVLKEDKASVEQRAREELGLVREGEVFFKVEQDALTDRRDD